MGEILNSSLNHHGNPEILPQKGPEIAKYNGRPRAQKLSNYWLNSALKLNEVLIKTKFDTSVMENLAQTLVWVNNQLVKNYQS